MIRPHRLVSAALAAAAAAALTVVAAAPSYADRPGPRMPGDHSDLPLTFDAGGVENVTYSNPYALTIERIWFDGKIVYAIEQGELDLDLSRVKVAQEYQVVYAVDLDENGKLAGGKEPERVEGQYNIYDSVPGMEKYSPLWQFNYVVVPRDYEPNSLRS